MALEDDIFRLEEFDQRAVQALMSGDDDGLAHALVEFAELRKRIRKLMLDETVSLITDEKAARLLRRISGGDSLPTDRLLERLGPPEGDEVALHVFDFWELRELASEYFYSWYGPEDYIRALGEVRPLILRSAVSDGVQRLVNEVRLCYAFQQYDAVCGMCRALLEACIRDICERQSLFPELGRNVVLLEKYSWGTLRDKVSSGLLRERLAKLYWRLCEVLHARTTADAEEAREAFQETLEVVEDLYDAHGL